MELKSGMKVVVSRYGEICKDAVVIFDEYNFNIYQNMWGGYACLTNHYKHSWVCQKRGNAYSDGIDFIIPAESTDIEDIYVGAEICDGHCYRKVLDCSKNCNVWDLSCVDNYKKYGFTKTIEQLKNEFHTLVPTITEPDIEITMKENGVVKVKVDKPLSLETAKRFGIVK